MKGIIKSQNAAETYLKAELPGLKVNEIRGRATQWNTPPSSVPLSLPPLTTCRAQQGARFIARRPPQFQNEGRRRAAAPFSKDKDRFLPRPLGAHAGQVQFHI